MNKQVVLVSVFSIVLALGACKRKGITGPEELAALTAEEAQTFASTLSAALSTCDKPALNTLIDANAMMRRAILQSKSTGGEQKGLLQGMRQNAGDIRSQFCGVGDSPGGLQFLRVLKRAGKQTILFRSVTDDALNYIEFFPGKAADGSIKADNVYIYANGQTLVETLTQMIDVLMGDTSVVAAFENIREVIAKDPGKALATLAALPTKSRESKPLQLLNIQAASTVDDATYEAAIADYERLFPGDPSLNLVSIDGFIVRKNFAEALKVIDRLDESVGGDSYLDELRVSLLLQEGKDLDRATEIAEKVLRAAPESEDAHYLLLGAHVANRNFGGAVAVMRLMGERFELVFEEDGLDPSDADYMALKASPEWAAYTNKLSDPTP